MNELQQQLYDKINQRIHNSPIQNDLFKNFNSTTWREPTRDQIHGLQEKYKEEWISFNFKDLIKYCIGDYQIVQLKDWFVNHQKKIWVKEKENYLHGIWTSTRYNISSQGTSNDLSEYDGIIWENSCEIINWSRCIEIILWLLPWDTILRDYQLSPMYTAVTPFKNIWTWYDRPINLLLKQDTSAFWHIGWYYPEQWSWWESDHVVKVTDDQFKILLEIF